MEQELKRFILNYYEEQYDADIDYKNQDIDKLYDFYRNKYEDDFDNIIQHLHDSLSYL